MVNDYLHPIYSCEICGKEFRATNKQQKVCGSACRNKKIAKKNKEKRERQILIPNFKHCPICGKEFEVPKGTRTKYCSDDCRKKFMSDYKKQTVACQMCGELFSRPSGSSFRFCSDACRTRWDDECDRIGSNRLKADMLENTERLRFLSEEDFFENEEIRRTKRKSRLKYTFADIMRMKPKGMDYGTYVSLMMAKGEM